MTALYSASSVTQGKFYMPAEWTEHERCWMSWPHKRIIWSGGLTNVKREIAQIAQAIAKFEPVTMLATPNQVDLAKEICGPEVTVQSFIQDDNWLRDTGPIFVINGKEMKAISLNFNSWGKKFPLDYKNDEQVAANLSDFIGLPITYSDFIAEGGAIELDGDGTLITTESCLLNPNRNPGVSKTRIEAGMKSAFGVDKVIWLPGNDVEYITDGHIDGMVRFVSLGVVLAELSDDPLDPEFRVLKENVKQLKSTIDAKGRQLKVITIKRPLNLDWDALGDNFAASYVNFYIANGGVVVPKFGDKAYDVAAKQTLENLFPGRDVVQIDITHLAKGGGGVHCSTQQQPKILI